MALLRPTFGGDVGAEALEDGHAALSAHAEAIEVEPSGLQGQRLLHGGHQVGVAAAAVGSPQQRQHQGVAVAPREGQWPAIGILQGGPKLGNNLCEGNKSVIHHIIAAAAGLAERHLCYAVAVLIQALCSLPVDTQGAGPAGGERPSVLYTAHQARYHHVAIWRILLLGPRPAAQAAETLQEPFLVSAAQYLDA